MAGIDPSVDPRGARWEKRLERPVLAAAWLALPVVFLSFSKVSGVWAAVTVGAAWAIWAIFLAEAIIMLAVAQDRRAWARGHVFGLVILAVTFPLLTKLLEALLAARALSSVQGLRVLQVLYVAKALKILKSVLIVRGKGRAPRHPVAVTALSLLLAVVAVGIGHRIATGEKSPTPVHGFYEVVDGLPLLP